MCIWGQNSQAQQRAGLTGPNAAIQSRRRRAGSLQTEWRENKKAGLHRLFWAWQIHSM